MFQGVRLDLFYPVFLTLQFAFFVGWLKVAETLINPFGEDDDDFELNRLIDRHIQVGFLICDPMVSRPELLKDRFWNQSIPNQMPYTKAAEAFKKDEYKGSAEVHLKVKDVDKEYSDISIYGGKADKSAKACESSDDNYESIELGTKQKCRKKLRHFSKKNKKPPPLPEKHIIPMIKISPITNKKDVGFNFESQYLSQHDFNSLLSSGYNEDDEEFEEISPVQTM